MKRYSFTKDDKLLKSWQFSRVHEQGEKLVGNLLIVYVLRVLEPEKKIGITVSKRRGKAHRRNRVKRLVREVYRKLKHDLSCGINIVVIARDKSAQEHIAENDIEQEMISLCKKAGIYEPPR